MPKQEKHTPGPWEIAGLGVQKDGRILFKNATPPISCVGKLQAEANARLIAAAPELLEAAKRGLACALSLDDDKSAADAAMLRAAISKAEGDNI